ncbi:MAG: hypothetical protein D6824_00190 [Planctomycetota bacterium]|nr:MAG: hypothetical protein D6824_00190 [Planctomycetota bacterium]
MSAKWRRSQAWDDRFFPAWAAPAKWLLRAFSSIWLAVALLTLIALYCAVASVPVGLFALAPTYALYGLTLLGAMALIAAPTTLLARRSARSPGARFALTLAALVVGAAAGATLWSAFVWPALRYDEATGQGVRLFAHFVAEHMSTTLRRLPAFEMTEPQFYAWWPMRLLLWLFVINLVVATVRRIEFRFENLGVLSVHTGIVVLALGSAQYASLKQEGDVLLLANLESPGEPGPAVSSFYDRDTPALWVGTDAGWRQRPLPALPRYNDYGEPLAPHRPLSIDVEPPADPSLPADLRIRVVGFAAYAELVQRWAPAIPPTDSRSRRPAVRVELLSQLDEAGRPSPQSPPTSVAQATLLLGATSQRRVDFGGAVVAQVVPSDARYDSWWEALKQPLPAHVRDGVVVQNVEEGATATLPAVEGAHARAGSVQVTILRVFAEPPFPIITKGFEGASSGAVLVRVEPEGKEPYERYVYTEFPELDQDILGVRDDGRPIRRDADPKLRMHRLDDTTLRAYVRLGQGVVVRGAGAKPRVIDGAAVGDVVEIAPMVGLRLAAEYAHVEAVEEPAPVPPEQRRRDLVGTYAASLLAVELRTADGWSRRVWLPFSKYLGVGGSPPVTVTLPGGRSVSLLFGREMQSLPGVELQLVDFEMIPYPHSDVPRDFVSLVQVRDLLRGVVYRRTTRLNRPLKHAPPNALELRDGAVASLLGSLLGKIAPNTYKFSQAGWDAQGWRQSLQEVRQGLRDRPRAAFTILGVGNNPGIRIVALGALLFCLGVPWAFYVKPWLVRRKSKALRAALERHAAAQERRSGGEEASLSRSDDAGRRTSVSLQVQRVEGETPVQAGVES